jgi:hypothetical protein
MPARPRPTRPALVETLETRTLLAAGDLGFAYPIGAVPKKASSNNDLANAVYVDRAGNTYLAGAFSGTVDFNPSRRRAFTLTSTGSTDAFVAKFAPDGAFLWARQAGGFGEDQATAVVVDRKGGVYVGGGFVDSADFRPGKKLAILDSSGGVDAFVWKLDGDGNLSTAVHAGGAGPDAVSAMALDGDGNVAIAGFFNSAAFFSGTTLVSKGGRDAFVAKLTPAMTLTYAKQVGGTGDDAATALAADGASNLYLAGTFSQVADFNPGAGESNLSTKGGQDAFLLKLNSAGNLAAVRQFGGTGNDSAAGVAVDRFGNTLVTGTFTNTVDFDPSASVVNLTTAGGDDVYVAKLDGSLNLAWARRAGGANPDAARALTVDKAGNVYSTGQFNGTVDFDPGAGTLALTGTSGVANGYAWKLNASGNVLYAKMLRTSAGFCEGRSIALNAAGEVMVAGMFSGTVDFDPGAGTAAAATGRTTSYDAFWAKLLA